MKNLVIVGRPNVGKSTLFNRLAKKRVAITEKTAGVTRDRVAVKVQLKGRSLYLTDTAGLESKGHEHLALEMNRQIGIAINSADLILLTVDAATGPMMEDEALVKKIRKSDSKVILVVNKVDKIQKEMDKIFDFQSLGIDKMVDISAEHNLNIDSLIKLILETLNIEKDGELEEIANEETLKLAIVGRPNVGKSSLTNTILKEERSIVCDASGTTRDSIEGTVKYKGKKITIVDTAGIRKKAKVEEDLEYYSVIKAVSSIQEADVAILVIDFNEGIKEQDKKIFGLAYNRYKPIIICANKMDKSNGAAKDKFKSEISRELTFFSPPILFTSAVKKIGIERLIDRCIEMDKKSKKSINTGSLNSILREIVGSNPPSARKGKKPKLNYMTQISNKPPTFSIFCHRSDIIHFSYKRYLKNNLSRALDLEDIRIKIKYIQDKN